jgi:hypothetical protein
MAGTGPQDDSPDGGPFGPPLSAAELRDWDFRERAAWLMGDYVSSYEADRGRDSYPDDQDEDDRYPYYGSSAEAVQAASRYRADAERAWRAQADTEAREPAARERLREAHAALERSWPWQRRRRAELRTLIEDAGLDLYTLDGEAGCHEFNAVHSERLCADAERAAVVLGRWERAQAASSDAVARTLGWQPGDALPVRCGVFRAAPDGIEELPAQQSCSSRPDARAAGPMRARAGPGGVRAAGQVMALPGRYGEPGGTGPSP